MRRTSVSVVLALVLLAVSALPAVASVPADPLTPETRAWLDEHGPLRIGWADDGPPLAVVEDGQVVGGLGVDLWDLAALQLGVDIEHVVVGPFAAVPPALADGTVDVAGAFGARPALAAVGEPAPAFAWTTSIAVVRPDRVDEIPATLDGATVTSIVGSPFVAQLQTAHPGAVYVETPSPAAAVMAVAAGEVDAYYGPSAQIGYSLLRMETDLVAVGAATDATPIAPFAPADSPALEIATAAAETLSDAQVAVASIRWTGFDLTDPAATEVPTWVRVGLPVLLATLLVLGVFVWVLRRRVAAATHELRLLNDNLEDTVDRRTAELAESGTRLKRSNKALQRFASTVAHDLRGPIAAIGGLAEVVKVMDLGPEERESVLTRIHSSAVRLGRMVDAMLEDAVELGATPGHIDGAAFESWLREVTAPELSVIDGRLSIEVPDTTVDADAEVLRRSALNLVGNATKYAANEHGVLIRVTLERTGATWEMTIEDNGPGIPQTMWSEVFETGRRLTHDDRGFGLGLGAIRDTVQGAGGAIRLGDSELGGASFVVTLPVLEAREAADELAPTHEASAT